MCADTQPLPASPTTQSNPAGYVFVSYKREDNARVVPIVKGLRASGLAVWWDEEIAGGNAWRSEITLRLQEAGCVVVVWSRLSVGDEGSFVRDEAQLAQKRRIALVPVRIDNVELPLGFGEVETVDLVGWQGDDSDRQFQRLIDAVRAKLLLPPVVRPADGPTNRLWEFVRRRKPFFIGAALAAAGGAVTLFTRTERHQRQLVARQMGKLVPGAPATNVDRRYAIDSLLDYVRVREKTHPRSTWKRRDHEELSDVHRTVVEFLAWRSKRRVPLDPCDSSTAWAFSYGLDTALDVTAALTFVRTVRRSAANLPRVSLDSSNLQRRDMRGADLRRVSFRTSCVDSMKFQNALLQGSDFSDSAHGRGTVFVRARLDSAQFAFSAFPGASFNWACLKKSDFTGARLERATFLNASISWANFSGALFASDDGWSDIDTTESNAFFVGARGLTPADSQWLSGHGAIVSGISIGAWKARRNTAIATGTAPSCK